MASNPNVNKVVYGNDTLIDLTGDTVTAEDVAAGVTAHGSDGAQITGTGIMTNKFAKHCKLIRNKVIEPSSQRDTIALCFNSGPEGADFYLYLTYSGANILLENEAGAISITLCSPGANYVTTFRLLSVNYISKNQALIRYRYETNASGLKSRIFLRLITLKYTSSSGYGLIQSSQINSTDAPTATVDVDGCLIPMYNDYAASFLLIQWKTTISTDAVAIYASRVYVTYTTGALTIPSSSAWVTLAASNASSFINSDFNRNFTEYGGLFFYDGANSSAEVLMWHGYSGGYKDVQANGDVLQPLDAYRNLYGQHILGQSADGFLVMYNKRVQGSAMLDRSLRLYAYDQVNCCFTQVYKWNIKNERVSDNLFMLKNGLLLDVEYKILYTVSKKNGFEKFADLETVTEETYLQGSYEGPFSDIFQGIFIY